MKRNKGFTLIELIVAVLFFGVASASIAMFYANNSRKITDSEKKARMEVASQKAYETFKGNLMQRMYDPGGNFEKLVFDSIWETFDQDDTIFSITDDINGILFNSRIIIDSFQFDRDKTGGVDDKNLARTFVSGSRIWATVKTKNLSDGDSVEMQTVFSHHR